MTNVKMLRTNKQTMANVKILRTNKTDKRTGENPYAPPSIDAVA